MARETLKRFYNSAAWKHQREYILHRDNFTCTEPGCSRVATEVHHIVELNEQNVNDYDVCLSETNLRSLCHDCHTRITSQMKCGTENVLTKIIFNEKGYPIPLKIRKSG